MRSLRKEISERSIRQLVSTQQICIFLHANYISTPVLYTLKSAFAKNQLCVKLVKHSYASRAFNLVTKSKSTLFGGPTVLLFGHDPILAAKSVRSFLAQNSDFLLMGGVLDGHCVIDAAFIHTLTEFENSSTPVAQICQLLDMPASSINSVLFNTYAGICLPLSKLSGSGA